MKVSKHDMKRLEVNRAMYPLWKLHKEHVVEFGSVDNLGDNQFR